MSDDALYRLTLGAIGRAKGPSLPAAVAYATRSKVIDLRQDMKWDYRRKHDLVHTETAAPADAPAPWRVVQHVVSEMDKAEKRKDGTTAKTLTLTLPRGMSKDQLIKAVRTFVAREITARGLVCIWGMHNPTALDGKEQPHAHLIISTRRLENGTFAPKKIDWLGNPKSVECRDETIAIREAWARDVNEALHAAGRSDRVTHMSRDQQRTLAAEIAADEARTLAERSAAAAKVVVIAETRSELKIGHKIVAQARREIEQIARETGEIVSLADHLVRRSPAAATVFALRAERRAINERLVPSIWTAEDQAALDAELAAAAQAKAAAEKAQADAAAAQARRRAEVEAIAQAAERQLAADRARLDDAGQRLNTVIDRKIETVSADVGRTWAEIVAFCRQIAETESKEKAGAEAKAKAEREQQERQLKEATRRQASLASAAPKVPKPPAAEWRAAEALDQKLRKDRPARAAAERRLRDLGATIEHGDGRTVILAESVNAVAGYDAMIQPGMRALIVPAAARAAEPTLLRAFFNWEISSAKEAGRRIVALINKGTTAFAAWVHEVAPHAEQIQPPQGAETWESLAPRRGSGDDSGGDFDVDRDDDDFRPA